MRVVFFVFYCFHVRVDLIEGYLVIFYICSLINIHLSKLLFLALSLLKVFV